MVVAAEAIQGRKLFAEIRQLFSSFSIHIIEFNVFRCVHNKDCIATVDDFIFDEELDKTLSSCHEVDIRSIDVLDDSICCKEEQTRCTTLPSHR